MNRRDVIILLVVLLSISCVIGTPTTKASKGTMGQSDITVPSTVTEYIIIGTVNVRSCPSTACGVVGYYYAGNRVTAECFFANSGEMWCSVPGGYIYAPCLGMEGVCR